MTGGKIRMAMVGGGHGAFIGAVHRKAAALDGHIELVAGAFSSYAEASRSFGLSLGLAEERCYADFHALMAGESALPPDRRCQFVSIVTPNHLHFEIALSAFEHGIHVFCEKPATMDVAQALRLRDAQQESGCLFGLAHTYTGYPMVKAAQDLVRDGELGRIVKVVVEYTQGWLAAGADETSKQAAWRLDPARSGQSSCMGDIGVHAAHLAEYVTGLEITDICADVGSVVPGRTLDDDGSVLLRFDNGARGVLMASQVHIGDENNLRLRVIGDQRSLEWSQLEPNTLWIKSMNQPAEVRRLGVGYFSSRVMAATRLPAGHPEGYIEAFANLYSDFASWVRAQKADDPPDGSAVDVPDMGAAIRGMMFIENVVKAGRSERKWFANTLPSDSGAPS